MTIELTPAQAELLNDVLSMQLQIEIEHMGNNLDSISRHKTLSIIQRIRRLKEKINTCAVAGDDVK